MNQKKRVKVIVIDSHPVVYSGLKSILETEFSHVELFGTQEEEIILKKIGSEDFDIVFLEVNSTKFESSNVMEQIFRKKPKTRILIFSSSSEELYGKRYLKLGAKGYLSKESSSAEVLNAVNFLIEDKVYISSRLSQIILSDFHNKRPDNVFDSLSNRELEVVRYLISGMSLHKISGKMHLHTSTIGTYKSRIFTKMNVGNVIDLKELARAYDFM